ncbi:YlqD family protein [Sinobaca sp. H24]|uniref:YlqD family protein n=1 Tax=Sinobaca sp. H24 TaxID=2923376 RepID=UPI002079C3F0|nr:YlqD family protein [Sinobaca sp. H24]
MNIIKKVTVKHVLTESLREKMLADFGKQKKKLQTEIEQLRFQLQKYKKSNGQSNQQAVDRLGQEAIKREDKNDKLDKQITRLKDLAVGTEISFGQVDQVKDVQVGDAWIGGSREEIIVKDQRVIEIRAVEAEDTNGMV